MQLLAMFTMLIDHVGIFFFPQDEIWRVIGRIAFPLYAYGIVQGWRHTRNRKRYIFRLSIIGAATQLPYMIYLQLPQINVIGTFLIVLAAFYLLERSRSKSIMFLVLIVTALILHFLPFEYGGYALGLMWIYRYLMDISRHSIIFAHTALNIFAFYYFGSYLQYYSIVSTFLIAYLPAMQMMKVPNWLWRSFYPAHLAVLSIIVYTTT